MTAYYNEWDAQAAAWLRELIKQGHIADGVVDERDIKEVEPADLREFTQCHFFAGIGGWSVALRLAGWDDERPVWTGSPPCQPFSVAGRGKGIADERHIAPVWLDLVKECRPAILFGEQVAAATSKDGWLDALQAALENEGYATGAAVLPACSVNAPHIRQRLWFTARLADSSGVGRCGRGQGHDETETDRPNAQAKIKGSSTFGGLADTKRQQAHQKQQRPAETERERSSNSFGGRGLDSRLADTNSSGLQGHGGFKQQHVKERRQNSTRLRPQGGNDCPAYASKTQWGNPDWLWCRDGKWRPVESSTFPLAHGIPARVGRLRGYGNAIVPQVAAEVVQVMMEYGND